MLLFRTLTYAIQIPIGAFTYMIWRRKKGWQKESSMGERRSSEQAAATV